MLDSSIFQYLSEVVSTFLAEYKLARAILDVPDSQGF